MKKKSLLAVAVVAALALFGSVGAAIALNSDNPTPTQTEQPRTQAPADDVTEADQASEADEAGDTDAVECENGIDPATGAACADDDTTEIDTPEADTAGDTDAVECENGIDPATGFECDGGPTTNSDDDQGEVDDNDAGDGGNLSSTDGRP